MSATETWTVGRLLTWTTEYLKKGGSASARLDAEVLLAHARQCQRIELYTAFDDEPDEGVRAAFREMVRRRAEGTPVAYLVGYKEFYSEVFEVNPDVLIPRPETEHLVVEALDAAKELIAERDDTSGPLRIADIGTGSGAIAISVAKHLPSCHVTAVDDSEPALAVARRNAEKHGLSSEQIEFRCGNMLEPLTKESELDLILSNPPYVSESEFEQLERTVRDFEPRRALVAGPTGAEAIAVLIEQAEPKLVPGGYLMFEFSPMLEKSLHDLISKHWEEPEICKDLAGLARVVKMRKRA